MTRLYNKYAFKERRKELRNNSTKEEILLWMQLQDSRLDGKKFRRQYGVGPYVLDFFCPEDKLCIELDGSQHDEAKQKEHDKEREKYLKELGIKIIRFKNGQVLFNMQYVLEEIKRVINRDD